MEQNDKNQNPYYLCRKTKRNNIPMKDNTKKSKIMKEKTQTIE